MIDQDTKIFDDKSLSDVFRDIYNNSMNKQVKIDTVLDSTKDVLKDVTSASLLLPMIKEILEISVKNDEQLVKLAAIWQRLLDRKEIGNSDPNNILPLEERRQLLELKKDNDNDLFDESINTKVESLSTMVEQAKKQINKEEKEIVRLVNET